MPDMKRLSSVCLIGTIIATYTYWYTLGQTSTKLNKVVTKHKVRQNGKSILPTEKLQTLKTFEDRRRHLQKVCENFGNASLYTPSPVDVHRSKYHMTLLPDDKLMFCASKKSGSTFLRRVAMSLTAFSLVSDPFSHGAPSSWTNPFKENDGLADILYKLPNFTNILFVRDPYSRLYSAWLDKFYNPNPYYWYNTNTESIEVMEHNTNPQVKCGTSVTFPEFIDGLYNSFVKGQIHDVHLMPSYRPCLVCHVNYTYVAKFEDYFGDLLKVLAFNNVSHRIKMNNIETKAEQEIIINGVKWLFRERDGTARCVSVKEGLQRYWNRLIARGILGKGAGFPLQRMSENEVKMLKCEHIIRLMLDVYVKSNQTGRLNNRDESMAVAYNNLSESSYRKIAYMFEADFQLFDYDIKRRFHTDGGYDYFSKKTHC